LVSVVELDVIRHGGIGIESNSVADNERNRLSFCLADRFRCLAAALASVKNLVRYLMAQRGEFLGG
jgi:hypothetical protein